MNYDSLYAYEKNQETKSYIWIIVLFALATAFMIRIAYTNSYYETGKKSEIITSEFKIIEVDEESSFFRVFVTGEFKDHFNCTHKPNKKINESAKLTYRIHEVKTSSGKYKTIPILDKDINCKILFES